jgi:hypothetical protein
MIWVPVLHTAMAAASSRQSAGCASAVVVAGPAGASAGGGTSSLLLSPGVSLRAGPSIVAPRAVPVRLPFAADRQDCGRGRPVPVGPDRGDR